MTKVATLTVLLLGMASGVALAQGAPPNSAWRSGYAGAEQAALTETSPAQHETMTAESHDDATPSTASSRNAFVVA